MEKQMLKTNKFIGIVIIILILLQIIIIYLEGISLSDPYIEAKNNRVKMKRIIPPGTDEIRQGQYVVNHFYKSEGFGVNDINVDDVTLVVHGTIDKLHCLVQLERVWRGPISLSIFSPGLDASFVDDAIDGLRQCWPDIRNSVSFHVVYPKTMTANMSDTGSFMYLSCKDVVRRLRWKRAGDFKSQLLTYPHNVMKNVARNGAITDWILHLDIDLLPTTRLRNRFVQFIKQTKKKSSSDILGISRSAFLLPAFEVRRDTKPINTKNQLLEAFKNNNARPYMQEVCPQCHKPIDYDRWNDIKPSNLSNNLNIAYSVPYIQEWEPFFITSRKSPLFDERITLYGFDRLFYMCVLQSMNYNFHVLNDEFLVHYDFRGKEKMSQEAKWWSENQKKIHQKFVDLAKQYNYTFSKYNKCLL